MPCEGSVCYYRISEANGAYGYNDMTPPLPPPPLSSTEGGVVIFFGGGGMEFGVYYLIVDSAPPKIGRAPVYSLQRSPLTTLLPLLLTSSVGTMTIVR